MTLAGAPHARAIRMKYLLLVLPVALLGCAHTNIALPTPPAATANASIARGESIVRNIAACGGCHAADEKNPDGPLSGGHEFPDWRIGVARGSNLTPDNETGLGTWTDAEIASRLGIGVRTIETHRERIMRRLDIHSVAGLTKFAIANGMVPLEGGGRAEQ